MKTSRQSRLKEWHKLRMASINGRLLIRKEIKRYMLLRKVFGTSLKPTKVVDNQLAKIA